jgi:hypothetical protein
MSFAFRPEISDVAVSLELRRSRLVGSKIVPFADWGEVDNSLSLPVARLRRLVEEGTGVNLSR